MKYSAIAVPEEHRIERLGEEVICPCLHRPHRQLHFYEPRDSDDPARGRKRAGAGDHLQPGHVRQGDVGGDCIEAGVHQLIQRLHPAPHHRHTFATGLKRPLNQPPKRGVIFDNEHPQLGAARR